MTSGNLPDCIVGWFRPTRQVTSAPAYDRRPAAGLEAPAPVVALIVRLAAPGTVTRYHRTFQPLALPVRLIIIRLPLANFPKLFMRQLGHGYLHRPAPAKGCSDDGWHRISICASESMRLNTSPQTKHSRKHMGFVGRSPLVNIITNSLPTLSSLIWNSLLQPSARRVLHQKPSLRHLNPQPPLSSTCKLKPAKCCGASLPVSATSPCADLRPLAGD